MARVGLGCMRLPPELAEATITAALEGGVTWLDTARAYGESEHIVGRVAVTREARIVTKCGMAAGWVADGRASTILADARTSARELGRPADILLLHAPDPRVGLGTSVRALLRARDEGLTKAIGLSNVTRRQLDELEVPAATAIAAVEVALGLADDGAVRGGVLAWCRDRAVPLLAHSPLGGPTKVRRLLRDPVFQAVAARHTGATPATIAIAYLLALDALVVPLVGARRPDAILQALAAESIVLDASDLAKLDERFPGLAIARRPLTPAVGPAAAEVVVIMGLAGSGKTRLAESYVADGFVRLNRDTLGGTLNGIAQRLGAILSNGETRVVLDNTYLTRAVRSEVVRVAHRAGARVRCVHVATPASEAQVNLVTRMLDRHGVLLGGAELAQRAKQDAGLFGPTTLYRMERQLELPSSDEGFAAIEEVGFVRVHTEGRAGVAMPLDRIFEERGVEPVLREGALGVLARHPDDAPLLVFGWRAATTRDWIAAAQSLLPSRKAAIEVAVCPHAAGPPVCWCRPPLPGLWLDFARRHGVDPRASLLDSASPVHRRMAETLGLVVLPE